MTPNNNENKKISVLIVDDHPVVREGLRTMLMGIHDIEIIDEAGDGLEAIEKAIKYRPQVILMDILMPNLDGIEATLRIKQKLPKIGIVVLTAYNDDAFIVNAIKAGSGGYLLKNSPKNLLLHTIRSITSGGIIICSDLLQRALVSLEIKNEQRILTNQDNPKKAIYTLTPREYDVLRLLTEGRNNKYIANSLSISAGTTKKYVQAIIMKLGVSDRTQAAVTAIRAGFLPFQPMTEEQEATHNHL